MGERKFYSVDHRRQQTLAALTKQCEVQNINNGILKWLNEDPPRPEVQSANKFALLDVTLGTLQQTVDFSWSWARSGLNCLRQAVDLKRVVPSDPHEAFVPWTLQWRWVELDPSADSPPSVLGCTQPAPGCGMLFFAAQHRDRVRMFDGKQCSGYWIHGLAIADDAGPSATSVLYATYNRPTGTFRLGSGNPEWAGLKLITPRYL